MGMRKLFWSDGNVSYMNYGGGYLTTCILKIKKTIQLKQENLLYLQTQTKIINSHVLKINENTYVYSIKQCGEI